MAGWGGGGGVGENTQTNVSCKHPLGPNQPLKRLFSGESENRRQQSGKGQDLLGGWRGLAQPSRVLSKNRTAGLIVTEERNNCT